MNPQQGQFGGQPQMVDDKGMMVYQSNFFYSRKAKIYLDMPIMMNQVGHPNGGYIMQMPVSSFLLKMAG